MTLSRSHAILAALLVGVAAGVWLSFVVMDLFADGGSLLRARDVVVNAAFAATGVAVLVLLSAIMAGRRNTTKEVVN